jgi:hypothetical protein
MSATCHGTSDPFELLKSFLADPEQRSLTLVLKRTERFDLPSFGCFGAFVVFLLFLGGTLIDKSVRVLRRGATKRTVPPEH